MLPVVVPTPPLRNFSFDRADAWWFMCFFCFAFLIQVMVEQQGRSFRFYFACFAMKAAQINTQTIRVFGSTERERKVCGSNDFLNGS